MATGYLIDSNSVIDFLNGNLPDEGRKLIYTAAPIISIITQIEIFSSPNISKEENSKLQSFVDFALIHPVNLNVAAVTIFIRQHYKTKTPDAIIAATAIVYDYILVSRNSRDFEKIRELKFINPHLIQ